MSVRGRWSGLHYLGVILVAFSTLQAVPLAVSAIYNETLRFPVLTYAIPAALSLLVGLVLLSVFRPRRLSAGTAMAVGALGWFALSLVGAIPYWLALDVTYLDAFFETTSGFTTTGATLFTGLSILPKSLLLWRALTQWIGGLGIFTLFLLVIREGGVRHTLLGAEAHKAASERFSPGVFSSLKILWAIYSGLTLACSLLLWVEGLSLFDAAVHGLTTVSTGGFSTYDDSIAHFAAAGFRHATAIEYTIIVFMFLGGTSFLIHWNALRLRFTTIARNSEFRAWAGLLLAAAVLVAIADRARIAELGIHGHLRASLFQVVSIATTTGFSTQEIAGSWFSPLSRQVLLVLMFFGGCVGSTSGGLKVFRVAVYGKLLRRQLRLAGRSTREVVPITVNGRLVAAEEIERTAAIGIAWIGGIALLWMVTLLLSTVGEWESLSAAVSAVGNIGPSFVKPATYARLGPAVKVCYILGMVAGRLEILPFLLVFSRRSWR